MRQQLVSVTSGFWVSAQSHMFKFIFIASYDFYSNHVRMWEMDHKEGWAWKNWCFRTVVLEKTLESPLGCKEITPVNPEGNQSWMFIGRTNAEAETPILWPLDGNSQLTKRFWSYKSFPFPICIFVSAAIWSFIRVRVTGKTDSRRTFVSRRCSGGCALKNNTFKVWGKQDWAERDADLRCRAEVVLQGCPTWRQGQRPCTRWLGMSCPAQGHNSDGANPWD